jgi:hypothetical protein
MAGIFSKAGEKDRNTSKNLVVLVLISLASSYFRIWSEYGSALKSIKPSLELFSSFRVIIFTFFYTKSLMAGTLLIDV